MSVYYIDIVLALYIVQCNAISHASTLIADAEGELY